MTDEELVVIEQRQKKATPEGRIIFESDIIEKDVPKLIAEVRRLQGVILEKPNFSPLPSGILDQFQRFWEACIELSQKADFKVIFGYIHRLEGRSKNAIPALEALLGVSHRLSGCPMENCHPCKENNDAVSLAKKTLEELKAS
jgi:hypothetical protein